MKRFNARELRSSQDAPDVEQCSQVYTIKLADDAPNEEGLVLEPS
ncbi:hypothetical protein [Paenarthrobacter sp. 22069]